MSARQGLVFFVGSSIKTVDDHCGYAFPWDPLQHITSNNAAYHDIHHQSWGIKTNFSQPFLTFWDRYLNTIWSGGDTTARYERTKKAAQFKLNAEKVELWCAIQYGNAVYECNGRGLWKSTCRVAHSLCTWYFGSRLDSIWRRGCMAFGDGWTVVRCILRGPLRVRCRIPNLNTLLCCVFRVHPEDI